MKPAAALLLALAAVSSGPAAALRSDSGVSYPSGAGVTSLDGEPEPASHPRSRRSAPASSSDPVSPWATAFHLNNSHLSLMVNWVGRDSSVVFCLARDQEMKPGATSQVYRSDDYGTTFADVSDRFVLADGTGRRAVIARYYHHPKSACHYVFADTVNR